MKGARGDGLQWCMPEVAIASGLDSTLGSHSFAAASFLSEVVIREIERRAALGLGPKPFQADPRVWTIGCREQASFKMDGDSPPRRRRKVIQAFFAISLETEQPYRITEDCDLWAVIPEKEEDLPVSIYLDQTHELQAEKSTFFACTQPFRSN